MRRADREIGRGGIKAKFGGVGPVLDLKSVEADCIANGIFFVCKYYHVCKLRIETVTDL